MTIRVIQWATGGVGRAAIEGVLSHPDLAMVGAWVHSPEKQGRDVGELLGLGTLGVTTTGSLEEVCALGGGGADVVVYAPLVPNEVEVVALLRAGLDVVTPVGWIYPNPAAVGAIEDSYCSLAWGRRLASTSDGETAASVLRGDPDAALDRRERALAAWARIAATDPNATTASDVAALRDAGLGEREIFEATALVALAA